MTFTAVVSGSVLLPVWFEGGVNSRQHFGYQIILGIEVLEIVVRCTVLALAYIAARARPKRTVISNRHYAFVFL